MLSSLLRGIMCLTPFRFQFKAVAETASPSYLYGIDQTDWV